MANYITRYVEKEIERKLKTSGAIVIEGPKFCGKTTTAMRFAKSSSKLITRQAIEIANMNPSAILEGDKPKVIDEWQTVPDLWNQVRAYVDDKQEFGQFILTGSSTPSDKEYIVHSGAGRIAKISMRPMSLYESGESSGDYSLSSLFFNEQEPFIINENNISLENIAHYICRGGWPLSVISDQDVAIEITRNYYQGLFNFEYSNNEKFRNKKPEILRSIVRSYARNISSQASLKTIREDVSKSGDRMVDPGTLNDYLEALNDLFIIKDLNSWNPNLRSKATIRSTPTRHFIDTSIASCALSIYPEDLMNDLETMGLFFEDMAVRDLSIYASSINGELSHYRDSSGLECDTIIHLSNGKWAAIEIKLGGEKLINEGIKNLKKLEANVLNDNLIFKMVLTATGPAYKADDVFVVPITMLKA